MLKQKIFNKQLNQWVDTDVGDGIDAYVLPATTPENAGKTLIFDEKGNAIPADPQGGSGLPEVEGSGKALVSVDGEWKEQEGYGYTTIGEAAIAEESVVTTFLSEYAIAMLSSVFSIEEGKTYKVDFDGVEYEIEARSYTGAFLMLGDMDPETGPSFANYPFLIYLSADQRVIMTETAGTHLVKIISLSEQIAHEFDSKYLPKSLFKINASIYVSDDEVVLDKTAEEIVKAYKNGMFCYIENRSDGSIYFLVYAQGFEEDDRYMARFVSFSRESYLIKVDTIFVNQEAGEHSTIFYQTDHMQVPKPEFADEGKVLKVVNGMPTWVAET